MMMQAARDHAHEKSLDSTRDSVLLIISTMCAVVGFSIVATIASSWSRGVEAKNTDSIVLISLLDLGHGPIHEQHGPKNYRRCENQH